MKRIVYLGRLYDVVISDDVDFAIVSFHYIIIIDVFQFIGEQITCASSNLVKEYSSPIFDFKELFRNEIVLILC